jgi:ribulose-5-phosphate 4-epimerase/fuculose-1-phosphate aldolase
MRLSVVSTGEDAVRQARIDLAAAYRLAARLQFDDTIWNHFSLRVPGEDGLFLVKAHGLLFREITASNLLVVDMEGRTVEGRGHAERSAFCIHSRIHATIPRAACVLHSHMRHAAWLSMVEGGRLLPVHQNALRFYNRISYDDHFCGMATDLDEGQRIANLLGDNNLAILSNHGAVSIAATVAQAFYDLYYLEVSCEEQYMLACSGAKPRLISHEVAERALRDYIEGEPDAPFEYMAAMRRLLEREEPDFMT